MRDPIPRLRPVRLSGPAAMLLSLVSLACAGVPPQSTIHPVTDDLGATIHDLYVTVFGWTMVILVVVWGLLLYVVIRFRARPGRGEPKKTRGNLALEIAWTAVPAIIVVLISVPTIRGVFRTQARPPGDALAVEVVAHQWWWEFRYPEEGIVTANELHVPVGRPVELRLASADVIHSFWVPRLGGKRDLNPRVRKPEGREPQVNRLLFTVAEAGNFRGQCAEFCGVSHALMGIRVIAQTPEEFQDWLQAMRAPTAPDSGTLADRGRQIFLQRPCVACHAIAGTGAQGLLGPNLTRLGARTTIGAGLLPNTPENLKRWIRAPATLKPGVAMPGTAEPGGGFPATALSEEELDAVVAFLSSLR